MERLLALRDVAAATSTSVAMWRKLLARKQLRAVRIGRAVRVPEGELSRFLARTETPRQPAAGGRRAAQRLNDDD